MPARVASLVLGAWLIVAPSALSYGATPYGRHDRILGLLITLVSALSLKLPGVRALNVGLGLWLVVSPYWYGYGRAGPTVNDNLVGLAVFGLALIPRWVKPRLTHAPAAPK